MDLSHLPPLMRRAFSSDDQMVHQYRPEAVLGQGGMGVVVAAHDTRLNRKVALKFMKPVLAKHSSAREMFLEEARAMAALDHPNIVRVYEVGEFLGHPFMAMELLAGESLDRLMEKEFPFSVKQITRIGYQVAAGLQEAHQSGIIHRDVKPANASLELSSGTIKVLDFGLARSAAMGRSIDPPRVAAAKKRSGVSDAVMVGTPGYIAPEQATDQGVDARSDLYSLGVMLFELIANRLPFEGETHADTLVKQLTESAPDLRSFSSDAPEALVRLIERCLQRNPMERPSTAGQVCKELRAIFDSLETSSPANESIVQLDLRTTPRITSMRRKTRSWRTPAFWSVGLVTLIGVAIAYSFSRSNEESPRIRAAAASASKDRVGPRRTVTLPDSPFQSRSDPAIVMSEKDSNVPDVLKDHLLIRTGRGFGRDCFIEDGSTEDFSSDMYLKVSRHKQSEGISHRKAFLRFDLSEIDGRTSDVSDAYLLLSYKKRFRTDQPNFRVQVDVLRDDSPHAEWEASGPGRITFSNNPIEVANLDLIQAGAASARSSGWYSGKKYIFLQHRNPQLIKQIQKDTDNLFTLVISLHSESNQHETHFLSAEAAAELSPCLAIQLKPGTHSDE
ncbi:MAG: protein kinase [Planctomycetota bacterium]